MEKYGGEEEDERPMGSRDRGSSVPARYLRAWTQAEAKIDAGGTSTADADCPSDNLEFEPRFSCFGPYELGKI